MPPCGILPRVRGPAVRMPARRDICVLRSPFRATLRRGLHKRGRGRFRHSRRFFLIATCPPATSLCARLVPFHRLPNMLLDPIVQFLGCQILGPFASTDRASSLSSRPSMRADAIAWMTASSRVRHGSCRFVSGMDHSPLPRTHLGHASSSAFRSGLGVPLSVLLVVVPLGRFDLLAHLRIRYLRPAAKCANGMLEQ